MPLQKEAVTTIVSMLLNMRMKLKVNLLILPQLSPSVLLDMILVHSKSALLAVCFAKPFCLRVANVCPALTYSASKSNLFATIAFITIEFHRKSLFSIPDEVSIMTIQGVHLTF